MAFTIEQCGMSRCANRELTFADLMSDPVIQAVMAADRVDPTVLERDLKRAVGPRKTA